MDQIGVTDRADDVTYNFPPVPTAMTMFKLPDGDSAVMACNPALSTVSISEMKGREEKRMCSEKRQRQRD